MVGDFYEKYLRFGLVLGRLAILKNIFWADYDQLLRVFFFMLFFKYCSVNTKNLHKMKVRKM